MSLSSTSHIKSQLITNLGPIKSPIYFDCLQKFVTGRISRTEFDETLKPVLDAPYLIQLHNALIISLFDARSHKRPLSPPPGSDPHHLSSNISNINNNPPLRKRRKVGQTSLPYQGPDVPPEELGSKSVRMKRWVVSLGRGERDRVKALPQSSLNPPTTETSGLGLRITEEIQRERPLLLHKERESAPGIRPTLALATTSRAPTIHAVFDRVSLICSQHNLSSPVRNVAMLVHLACEVKLKQLITHALTLTTQSLAISSVTTSQSTTTSSQSKSKSMHAHQPKLLSTAAFETLFTVSPTALPNKSAAGIGLLSLQGDRTSLLDDENNINEGDIIMPKDGVKRETTNNGMNGTGRDKDPRWQIAALLAQRSAVRDALAVGVGLR